MPSLVLPNACQVRLLWTFNGVSCVNVLGGQIGGGFVNSQAHADALSTAVGASLASSGLQALLATTNELAAVGIRDLRTPNQAEYISTDGQASGENVANPLPNQLACVVTLRTALAGKSFRGRVYLGGFSEADNTASGTMSGGLMTAAQDFITAVSANMFTQGITLAVLSRPRESPPWPVAYGGAVTTVTSITTRDSMWDTQRRRRT